MLLYQLCTIPRNNKYECRMIFADKSFVVRFQMIKLFSVHDKNRLIHTYQMQLKQNKSKLSFHVLLYELSSIQDVSFNTIQDILQCNLFVNRSFQKSMIYQICAIENLVLRKVCVRKYMFDLVTWQILYHDELQLSPEEVEQIRSDSANYVQTYITNDTVNIPLLHLIVSSK